MLSLLVASQLYLLFLHAEVVSSVLFVIDFGLKCVRILSVKMSLQFLKRMNCVVLRLFMHNV